MSQSSKPRPHEPQRLQKITNRPIKQGNGRVFQENADVQAAEYAASQQRKKEQFNEIEQRMLKKMYGTQEEKAQIAQEEYNEMQKFQQLQQKDIDKRREEEKQVEMKMIEQIKYQEMVENERKIAEDEYKQFLAFQFEQEQKLRSQNKALNKQMEKADDQEQMAKFFSMHFAKSIR